MLIQDRVLLAKAVFYYLIYILTQLQNDEQLYDLEALENSFLNRLWLKYKHTKVISV